MLIQIIFNLLVATGLFIVFKKLSKSPKDDPRLSRGLQLLQSKIAILEDLADRTEVQVKQLTTLIDSKSREVQAKIQAADVQIRAIEASMEKSREVAQIFQDRIPHEEIIERQNTVKYVEAARLAHKGMNAEQIREQIDLPVGELDFIVKLNRNQLMFAEEELPAWIDASTHHNADAKKLQTNTGLVSSASTTSTMSEAAESNFRQVHIASEGAHAQTAAATAVEQSAAAPVGGDTASARQQTASPADNPEETLKQLGERFRRVQTTVQTKSATVRKFEFPRIDKP